MKLTLLITYFLFSVCIFGQSLYIQDFGNNKNTPVVFLHGGPGYNSANFEVTTAQKLSDQGFYVIVYDRRGEGRSVDLPAKYTFKETFDDLNKIYKQFHIKKAILIGHSFGGILATLYAELFPKKVHSVILAGAPINIQESFRTIINKVKNIYINKNDSINLSLISMIERMDSSSFEYSSYCLMHASLNGFYTPKQPTEDAKLIYYKFKTDSILINYASKMTYAAPKGFWKNESYTTLNLTEKIKYLVSKKVKVYGLYGKHDGLYSEQQIDNLQTLIGVENIKYWDNCSHNIFIDQQSLFVQTISDWYNK